MTADIHSLAGAFALDALADDELRDFTRHLAVCEACTVEVEEFRATTSLMGAASAEAPPASMRAAVMSRVATTPQVRPEPAPVTSLRQRFQPMLLPVAAGLVLLVAVLTGVVRSQQSQLSSLELAQAQNERALLAVLTAPDNQTLAMHGDSGNGLVMWSASAAQAVLFVQNLDDLPEEQAYQLWFMRDGVPQPSAVFSPGTQGRAMVALDFVPDRIDAVAVTIEPSSGSSAPTGPMVLTPA